jgi:hypothetical protein
VSAFAERRVLLFAEPAREANAGAGLSADLTPARAAALRSALLADQAARLASGRFVLRLAWTLGGEEPMPPGPVPGIRLRGAEPGERLAGALADAAVQGAPVEGWQGARVIAIAGPLLELTAPWVEEAFELIEAGAPAVLGPTREGALYLVGLRAEEVDRRLFTGLDWTRPGSFGEVVRRCRELGREPHLLPEAEPLGVGEALSRLADRVGRPGEGGGWPRTRALFAAWAEENG